MNNKFVFLVLGFILGLTMLVLLGSGGNTEKRFELHFGQGSFPLELDTVTGDVKLVNHLGALGKILPWKEQ